MRLRFFLAFSIIILTTLAGVEFFVRTIAAQEVHTFINRGGALGIEDIVTTLENYYRANGSWDGTDMALLSRLKKRLNLARLPKRIECFDNSHLFGRASVSGMVVFEKGRPKKRILSHIPTQDSRYA